MIRPSIYRNATLFAVAVLAAACHRCGAAPAPPTQEAIEKLADPYDTIPMGDAQSFAARAANVINAVAQELGYGNGPAQLVVRLSDVPWMKTQAVLIAKGNLLQVKAAWEIISAFVTTSDHFTGRTKLAVKTGQARIWGYENTHQSAAFLKKAYLAEITWCFYVIRDFKPDTGAAKKR